MQKWVVLYVEEKRRTYPVAAEAHESWLVLFVESCDKEITDLTTEDYGHFVRAVDERYGTTYARLCALKALGCFIRFYRARGHHYLRPVIHSEFLRRVV